MLDLIYDRTDADVSRVLDLTQKLASGTATDDEKTEWFAGMKGAYNASDLDRVDAAVAYIRDRMNSNGYAVNVIPYASWLTSDIPTKPKMQEYLGNVDKIRQSMALPDSTPETPETMEKLDYNKANDIEKILETVDRMLTNSLKFLWYSGELYAGEVI